VCVYNKEQYYIIQNFKNFPKNNLIISSIRFSNCESQYPFPPMY